MARVVAQLLHWSCGRQTAQSGGKCVQLLATDVGTVTARFSCLCAQVPACLHIAIVDMRRASDTTGTSHSCPMPCSISSAPAWKARHGMAPGPILSPTPPQPPSRCHQQHTCHTLAWETGGDQPLCRMPEVLCQKVGCWRGQWPAITSLCSFRHEP